MSSKNIPIAKKSEIKLQSRLEMYKSITDPNVPDCWVAYKKVKHDIMVENKLEKKKEKDTRPNIVKEIHRLLSDASRMAKWGDILKSQGLELEAEKEQKEAEIRVKKAHEFFDQQLTQNEKDTFNKEELDCLRLLTVPTYPYKCSKTEIKELEQKETSIIISKLNAKIEECEKIIRKEQTNSGASKALIEQLMKQIEYSLPFIENKQRREKIERFLEQIK